MTTAPIDIKRCLALIKKLQAEKQLLREKNNEVILSKIQSEQQFQDLQRRYDELNLKFETYANSQKTGQSIPSEEDALDENRLSQHNQSLESINKVKQLEDLLEQKNKENVALQQNLKKLNQDILQVSKLKSFLQESKSLNSSYMAAMDKLHSRLDGFGIDCCKETLHPQAVSGDQDVITSPISVTNNNPLQKELDRVKAENQELISRLQPLQSLEAERDSIFAQKSDLEEHNKRLQTEINILSTAKAADFPIESQIRVFLDDFQDERKEKEQQYREKQEIYEENQKLTKDNERLKQKLESLSHCMTDLQQRMAEWSPPRAPSNHDAYDRGGASSQTPAGLNYPQSPSMDYHLFHESSRYYDSQTSTRPTLPTGCHGGPLPLNRTPAPSEFPRRIGFSARDTPVARGPVSPPMRANNPNFAAHGSRPPLVTRQLANSPRPQFSPVSYMQGCIQSDSSGDFRTCPKVPDSST